MQWFTVPTPRRPLRPPAPRAPHSPRAISAGVGHREILPDRGTRCLELELENESRLVARHFRALPIAFLLPGRLQIAHPAGHVADDVDRFLVRDQALGRGIDAHGLDAGIGIERVGMAPETLVDGVLQEAMHDDHIGAGELLAAGHLVLDERAVMRDELDVQILHLGAGLAGAGGRLADVAQPSPEGEIGGFHRVLQQRSVHLLAHRIDERGIALELRQPEGGTQAFQ
jgi:hypothetical protein